MSLLTGESRSADVTALTDLVVYEIHRKQLSKIFQVHPEFIETISEILVERKYQNAQMLEKLTQHISTQSVASTNILVDRIRSLFKVSKSSDNQQND
jgi:CRP-like cAMP-binding protein